MEVNASMNQNIDTLFQNIESFTQNEGTLGKSITLGDKTVVPIISVAIGYGGGNTSGKMLQGSSGSGHSTANSGVDALGLGAKITTDAVAVLDSSNNISVIPVNTASSGMNQLMNKLPQMMGMGQGQQGQQNQQQNQQGQQSTS